MSNILWGALERLKPGDLSAIKKRFPIAYIPWGAIEWHGLHNPLGLDAIKARGLCERLAEKTGGVVLPPFYVGMDTIKPFKGFGNTLDYSREVVEALVRETLEQLADEGFRVLVLLTGHYGSHHVQTVKVTAQEFASAHSDVQVWAFPDSDPLDGFHAPDHAGLGETSLMLYLQPELVDLSRLDEDREITLDSDGIMGGDPRKATPQIGRQQMQRIFENTLPKIQQMLERVSED